MSDTAWQVLRDLAEMRGRLEKPTSAGLDQCRPLLEALATALKESSPAMDRHGLLEVRRELRHISLLLEGAADFHMCRLQSLMDLSGGYNASGGPASMEPERHRWCRG